METTITTPTDRVPAAADWSRTARQSFVVLALAVAFSGLAGCGTDDEPEERRVALSALLEELELEPLPGHDRVRIGRTQSKSDAPYFSATGILEMSRASGIAHVESAFAQRDWDVIESGNVGHFLGSCIRARKPSIVAITYVGWSDMPTNNVYPRLPGRVYVQTLVGREGSNQGWTDVERELC